MNRCLIKLLKQWFDGIECILDHQNEQMSKRYRNKQIHIFVKINDVNDMEKMKLMKKMHEQEKKVLLVACENEIQSQIEN